MKKINKITTKNSEIYFKLFQSIIKLNIKKILSFQRLFFGKLKFIMIHGFKLLINLKDKEKLNDLKKIDSSKFKTNKLKLIDPSKWNKN